MANKNTEQNRQELVAFVEKNLKLKTFSSGKDGFGAYGRVETSDGTEYQLSLNATRIGS